jgi:hypothetical protein
MSQGALLGGCRDDGRDRRACSLNIHKNAQLSPSRALPVRRSIPELLGVDHGIITNCELNWTNPALRFRAEIDRFLGYTLWVVLASSLPALSRQEFRKSTISAQGLSRAIGLTAAPDASRPQRCAWHLRRLAQANPSQSSTPPCAER